MTCRIGIDARMMGEEQTGIGKYITRLCERVPALLPDAHFVFFLREPAFSRFRPRHENVEVRKTTAYWYGYREQLLFPWELARARLDLVHFPHFNAPLLYPGKFIVTIHDLTPLLFRGGKDAWRRAMFRLVFSGALQRSQRVIAVSRFTKQHLIERFGTSSEKIEVIGEGVDDAFRETTDRARSAKALETRYGIAEPFLLYVGVWREHKNLVGLLEAYRLLRDRYGICHELVLCGKEHIAYPDVRKTWERLDLEQFVKRPGFVLEADLPHFYRVASLTVVPSFAEGFGFTGLESLACGTPVAASNVTSLPEVLGEAAWYFDPRDPADMARMMHGALTDEAGRAARLVAGKNIVARCRWDETAEKTVALYRDVLGI